MAASLEHRFGIAAILSIALLAWLVSPTASKAATQAQMSDSVVESIGVNTHLNYDGTPYGDFARVRQSLNELGIRYIRDQVGLNRADIDARFRQLAAEGIHLDVIAGDPRQRWGTGTVSQQLNVIQNELGSAVTSIEGPNEYDLSGFPNWAAELRTYTRELAEGVRSRPRLASIPIIGPSIVIRENDAILGDLTPWIDYGNTHTYMGGEMPETPRWNDELASVSRFAGSEPVVASETGYQNALKTTNGHLPTSERATAIYMPRLFLENFRRGITRSYSYQLLDESNDSSQTDIEASFGLLHNDFTKKPAAVATQNLISLLSDRGASFTPGALNYSVEGAPASSQQVLLQKRDGSFYLAIWNRVSVWDRYNRVDLEPASVPITVRFGQPIASAEIYEPNRSASAVSTVANPTSLRLSLSPRVQLIKLTPGNSTTPATEAPPAPAPPAEPPVAETTPVAEITPSGETAPVSAAPVLPPVQTPPVAEPSPSAQPAPAAAAHQTKPVTSRRQAKRQRAHGRSRGAAASAGARRTRENAHAPKR